MEPRYLLTTAYLGPVHYYTKLYAGHPVVEERCDHYVKQTYRNRCIIATADGPLALTLPIEGRPLSEGGTSKTPTGRLRLSEHGRWRDLHWNALVSAYERTPYFFYYADDFERIYRGTFGLLADFNAALRDLVLDLLDLHPQITVNAEHYLDAVPTDIDLRERIRPKIDPAFDPEFHPAPYHQLFAVRHGFLPNLSIVDLLFNLGPESRRVLRDSRMVP